MSNIASYAQNLFNKLGNFVKEPILSGVGDWSFYIRLVYENYFSSGGATGADEVNKTLAKPE